MKHCRIFCFIFKLKWTAILALATSSVIAQNLPAIPKEWPINYLNDLLPRKELVEKHFKEYDLKIEKYNAKCGNGEIPENDHALKSFCDKWSDELDKESLELDKEKDNYMAIFNDYDSIYKVFMKSKEFQMKEEEKIRMIANQGKPVVNTGGEMLDKNPFGTTNTPKNPDLKSMTNVDLSLYWGGSKGTSPDLPDLNYGNKNLAKDFAVEQKLAQKYPAFNEILVKENKLKDDESNLKKEGVTLYKEIKEKGAAATKEDWDKLAVVTDNLKKVNEDLKKATEEKEKAKNDYKVKDNF